MKEKEVKEGRGREWESTDDEARARTRSENMKNDKLINME